MKRIVSRIFALMLLVMLVAPMVEFTPAAQACAEKWYVSKSSGCSTRKTSSCSSAQVGCLSFGCSFVISKKICLLGQTWGYVSSCTTKPGCWGTVKGCWINLIDCKKGEYCEPTPPPCPPVPPAKEPGKQPGKEPCPPEPPVCPPPQPVCPPPPCEIGCNETWIIDKIGGCQILKGCGLLSSIMGCLMKGSTICITKKKVECGVTWGYVSSCSSKLGSWGSAKGGWVNLTGCKRK